MTSSFWKNEKWPSFCSKIFIEKRICARLSRSLHIIMPSWKLSTKVVPAILAWTILLGCTSSFFVVA